MPQWTHPAIVVWETGSVCGQFQSNWSSLSTFGCASGLSQRNCCNLYRITKTLFKQEKKKKRVHYSITSYVAEGGKAGFDPDCEQPTGPCTSWHALMIFFFPLINADLDAGSNCAMPQQMLWPWAAESQASLRRGCNSKGLVRLCAAWRDACTPGNTQLLLLPSVRWWPFLKRGTCPLPVPQTRGWKAHQEWHPLPPLFR